MKHLIFPVGYLILLSVLLFTSLNNKKTEEILPTVNVGECYSGEFGHFKKETLQVIVYKTDGQYVLFNWCNKGAKSCYSEDYYPMEYPIRTFVEFYPTKSECLK